MSGEMKSCCEAEKCGERNACFERKCVECEIPALERNNYFCGKLMVERDFWCDQNYHIGKQRLHNRAAHGWGTLCGLKVKQHPVEECRDKYVILEPGVAFDCCGREIQLREEVYIALFEKQAEERRHERSGLFVAIRYRECFTEPVQSLFSECGCDDGCEPNRIKEGYEVKILSARELGFEPRAYKSGGDELKAAECKEIHKSVVGKCPECEDKCAKQWVVLASIPGYVPGFKVIDGSAGGPGSGAGTAVIDNYTNRRLVPSTDKLYEIIRCILENGGNGGKGDKGEKGEDGVGLEEGLTYITGISWIHARTMKFSELENTDGRFTLEFSNPVTGVDVNSFFLTIRTKIKHDVSGGAFSFSHDEYLPGNIIEEDNKRISFELDKGLLASLGQYIKTERSIRFGIFVKCDFIIDNNKKAVAGHHIGGRGQSGLRIQNRFDIQGGLFESWITVENE